MTAFDVIVTAAVVTNGLLAGLFFAFTCAVSPALVRASSLCHSHAAFACLVVGAEYRLPR